MIKNHLRLVSLAVLMLNCYAASAAAPNPFPAERELFINARLALSNGEKAEFQQFRAQLGSDYPIAHYLDYQVLHRRISSEMPSKTHVAALNQFEREANDESLTKRLTVLLQKRAAAEGQWELFEGVSKSNLADNMKCFNLQAQADAGGLSSLNDKALALWVEPKKYPKACAELLDKLESAKAPPIKAIWQRIYKSMDAAKPANAKSVLKYLSKQDRQLVQGWIEARDKPEAFLKSGALSQDTSFNRRATTDLVLAWSKSDPVAAMTYWLANYSNYRFYSDRYYDTHRLLAMRGAYRRLPEAYQWLNSLEARDDDLELKEWRIRTALFEKNWINIIREIKRLPAEEQSEDHWAYWEARALEALGHRVLASEIYTTLSKLPTYHGFLSADKLNVAYNINDVPIDAEENVISDLENSAAIQRANEYYAVDVQWEGRREWNALIASAKPAKLAALAVLADRWEFHDRALYAAGKAKKTKALTTRFPVMYGPEVMSESDKNRIPPAWVFGVMRRESGYIRDVKSSAGAIGLMQLMPKTADYVAKLRGEKNWSGDLTDAETNIKFGTFYLRYVLDKFEDHQILATASYNAGPSRINKWLPPEEMAADIWIDAIPYSETRRYVRAVMAYTIIYEWRLTQQPTRLAKKLTAIPAAPGT